MALCVSWFWNQCRCQCRPDGVLRMTYRPHVPRTTLRDMVAALVAYPQGAVMLVPFALVWLTMRYL